MSFSLTNTFEDRFEYQGQTLFLDLYFDNILRMFELFKDPAFNSWEKVVISLEILLTVKSYEYVKPLSLKEKHALFLFVMKDFLDIDLENPSKEDVKKVYDFQKDAGLIYASFLQAYNLDLFERQGKLHWKKFIQLFTHLPENTSIKEVIKIRTEKVPAPTKYNSEERKRILTLKSLYKLEDDGLSTEEAQKRQIQQNEDNFNKLASMFRKKGR